MFLRTSCLSIKLHNIKVLPVPRYNEAGHRNTHEGGNISITTHKGDSTAFCCEDNTETL
jgi:hypothetical protein